MIRTTTLLEAAFWRDPTYGINAMLAALPRDKIGGGTDAAAPSLNVYSDADDAGVAQTLVPPELPSVIVFAQTAEVDRSGRNRRALPRPLVHAFGYVTDEGADELEAQRVCELVLRAGRLVFDNYLSHGDAAGLRQINGIRVLDVPKVLERRVTATAEKVKLWGWLEVHSTVADGIA